jgi:PAS domain S-box-containing protein
LQAQEALKESREKYRSIFEHSPEMIVLLDAGGALTEANNKVEDLLGYARADVLGKHFTDFPFWSDETKKCFSRVIARAFSDEITAPFELEFLPRGGSSLTCWANGTTLRDSRGAITHILLILTDVTEQRRVEQALREEKDRVRDYLNVAGVILVALDSQLRVTLINRKGCAILRRTEAEILGHNWLDVAIPEGQREIFRAVHALLLKGDTQAVEYFENSIVSSDGVERIIAWRNTLVRDASGDIVGTLSSGEDITQRKQAEASLRERTAVLEREVAERRRAEEQLRESREDFRRLAGKVLYAQESERGRIARELHDDITQRLALTAIEAANLRRSAPELSEEGRGKLDALQRQLETVAADVQDVSRVLHPSILKDLGLEDAVTSECAAFRNREGIEIAVHVDGLPHNVGDEAALCLFRILQEALWNIAKHSCAETVQVSLRSEPGELVLSINDDGIGFDVNQARRQRGMGLASMQERAHLVGGRLCIESQPDAGTKVQAHVPLLELSK